MISLHQLAIILAVSSSVLGTYVPCPTACPATSVSMSTQDTCMGLVTGSLTVSGKSTAGNGVSDLGMAGCNQAGNPNEHIIQFRVSKNATYIIDTEANYAGTDTILFLFTCAGVGIGCDDDAGTGSSSLMIVPLTTGVEYVAIIEPYRTDPDGTFSFTVKEVTQSPTRTPTVKTAAPTLNPTPIAASITPAPTNLQIRTPTTSKPTAKPASASSISSPGALPTVILILSLTILTVDLVNLALNEKLTGVYIRSIERLSNVPKELSVNWQTNKSSDTVTIKPNSCEAASIDSLLVVAVNGTDRLLSIKLYKTSFEELKELEVALTNMSASLEYRPAFWDLNQEPQPHSFHPKFSRQYFNLGLLCPYPAFALCLSDSGWQYMFDRVRNIMYIDYMSPEATFTAEGIFYALDASIPFSGTVEQYVNAFRDHVRLIHQDLKLPCSTLQPQDEGLVLELSGPESPILIARSYQAILWCQFSITLLALVAYLANMGFNSSPASQAQVKGTIRQII